MPQEARGEMYVGLLRYIVKNYFISKRQPCNLLALNAVLNHLLYDILCVLKRTFPRSTIITFLPHQRTSSSGIKSNFNSRQRTPRRTMNINQVEPRIRSLEQALKFLRSPLARVIHRHHLDIGQSEREYCQQQRAHFLILAEEKDTTYIPHL